MQSCKQMLTKIYAERRLMGYSVAQMFDVVIDIAAYKDFLPWCHSSIILNKRPNHISAEMKIGIQPLTEKYISNVSFSRATYIFAESRQGHLFNHLVTSWKFSPGIDISTPSLKSHPNSCIVDFSVSFEFRSVLQAKLGNVFFDETAKAMTSAFYVEAKRRYGKESVPNKKIQIVSSKDNNASNKKSS